MPIGEPMKPSDPVVSQMKAALAKAAKRCADLDQERGRGHRRGPMARQYVCCRSPSSSTPLEHPLDFDSGNDGQT